MEPLSTTFAKAIDDLSTKISIPALTSSYFVEFGPWLQGHTNSLFLTYLIILIISACSLLAIFAVHCLTSMFLFKGNDIGPIIGILIMPLGFAGLFPDHFQRLHIPYSQVTGVAILAWAFVLIERKYLDYFFGEEDKQE